MNEQLEIMKKKIEEIEDYRREQVENTLLMILREKRFTVSLLQRRLRIGFTSAARISDELQGIGIIGEEYKPELFGHSILISLDEIALLLGAQAPLPSASPQMQEQHLEGESEER